MISSNELKYHWTRFFQDRGYSEKIDALCDKYPDTRSLTVEYPVIDEFNSEFSEYLLNHPDETIKAGEDAMLDLISPESRNKVKKLNLRIEKLPLKACRIPIKNLRAVHLDKFIAIDGLVKKVTEVRPRVIRAAFACRACMREGKGEYFFVIQDRMVFQSPSQCPACKKGGDKTKFDFSKDYSEYIDTRKIEIQEHPEEMRGRQQPDRLVCYIEDDIVGNIAPGERVILNGILKSVQREKGMRLTTLFDFYLEVNFIEKKVHEYEEISLTDEDIQLIEEAAKDEHIVDNIVNSIAPTIYGLYNEKTALALQLFGGVEKNMPDGTKIRGDIHILLVGDPGTAKSQILKYISGLSPRGIYASGKAATGAGLTATAVRDEFGEGRWTLEAGTLVLADRGIACVDEMDKIKDEERSSIHEAMEQQTISIAKAGISAQLLSRCALLGAANPKYGRFDPSQLFIDQIDLPIPLVSRFDIIFAFFDVPEKELDSKIADHVLRGHKIGELLQHNIEMPDQRLEFDEKLLATHKPYFNREFLRKYIAYAKRNYPVITEEALHRLREYYVDLRHKAQSAHVVSLTLRQLEALVRLSEASARLQLKKEVTVDDTNRAIEIVNYFLSKVASIEGVPDIDILSTGMSRKKRNNFEIVESILRELSRRGEGAIPRADVIELAKSEGVPEQEVDKVIQKLKDLGHVWEPTTENYRYMLG